MEARHAAYILRREGFTQETIARLLRRDRKTIISWEQKGKWKEKILRNDLFQETSEESVQDLIAHNLDVLKLIAEKKASLIKNSMSVSQLQEQLIERGDIDALQKLFTTIKGKELAWSGMVKILREFIEYLERENIHLAKKVLPFSQEFLNEKRKEV